MAGRRSSLVALLLTPATAVAMVVPLSLDELTSQSKLVVHGEVVELQSHRTPDRSAIYSDATVRIIEVVLSRVEPTQLEDTLTVRVEGGKIGDEEMRTSVSPELKEGQQGIVFLTASGRGEPYSLVGGTQGWLPASDGIIHIAGSPRELRELIAEIRR